MRSIFPEGIITFSCGRDVAVDEITRPFFDLWNYVERVGGFPGKVFFCIAVIFVVLGGLTWYGNRR